MYDIRWNLLKAFGHMYGPTEIEGVCKVMAS